MKKFLFILFLLLAVLSTTACGGGDEDTQPIPKEPVPTEPSGNNENNNQTATSMKMNITVGNHTITATMEDNAAARDLLSRLPLKVTLDDFNNTTEKIFYPSPALTIEGVTRGCAPKPGDITIYVPWGNVAIFCKSWSHSNDLIKIGHIDGNGIEELSVDDDITVKFMRYITK